MDVSGDDIAELVLKQFDALPGKAKPLVRSGGVKEWVPLSGIVAQGNNSLTCLSIATGMKCLPQDKVSRAQGIVLHDWHAEVLAIRSFNRFLLEECHALLLSKKKSSEYLRMRTEDEIDELHFQPFALNGEISLHMYCSEAPCGDASMELTMAAQEDSTPWAIPPASNGVTSEISTSLPNPFPMPQANPGLAASKNGPILHGRGYFSELGIVRRKPSRPDAPPTLSKSCSDKIALKQCTSLLSSVTSLLVSPANMYISSLVLPESQYSEIACRRAFSSEGRMKEMKGRQWDGGYRFKDFNIRTTSKEFKYSRRQFVGEGEKLVPSNISASWTASSPSQATNQLETLIGGVLQGRKQHDVRGASRVCKRQIWKLAIEIAALAAVPMVERCLRLATYGDVKSSELLQLRRKVKHDARKNALKGWVRNTGSDQFVAEGAEP